jgi:hypothetical protein
MLCYYRFFVPDFRYKWDFEETEKNEDSETSTAKVKWTYFRQSAQAHQLVFEHYNTFRLFVF